MLPTHPGAGSLDEGSSSSADEIGNLERRRGHWSTSSPIVTHTYIKTAWQSLLRSLMRSVRRRAATSKRANRTSQVMVRNLSGNPTYQAHALISLRIQDTGLLDWLNATLKNGFDKTAGDRV